MFYRLIFNNVPYTKFKIMTGLRHSLGGKSLASHHGGPGSIPGQVMWDLQWRKWQWGRFYLSTSVSPANSHSTDCSAVIIVYHPGLV
jgi:hypothetical protein